MIVTLTYHMCGHYMVNPPTTLPEGPGSHQAVRFDVRRAEPYEVCPGCQLRNTAMLWSGTAEHAERYDARARAVLAVWSYRSDVLRAAHQDMPWADKFCVTPGCFHQEICHDEPGCQMCGCKGFLRWNPEQARVEA